MARALFVLPLVLALVVAGCLDQPGVGRAASPGSAPGPAPWGSATSNDEMQKKVKMLEDILDGRLTLVDLQARVERDYGAMKPEDREKTMAPLKDLLEARQKSGKIGEKIPPGPDRDMAFAQLYFSERRFIEAGTILSKILDVNPVYPEARNLLARCFFFLGNRDRTLQELEFILQHPEQQKDKDEVLDALFLIGAAVAESPGISREGLEKGKNAWETYLKMAPESPQRANVENGLKEIEAGLRGEGRLAQPLTPVASEGGGQAPRNVMGGSRSFNGPAPMGPGTAGAPAPRESRVAALGADATPYDRALATGLDALESRDLANAEKSLKEANGLKPNQPEVQTALGRVFVQSGRFPDALRTFGEVIKANPNYMPAWHYNGMAHMMSGSPKEAVKSWETILEKDPAYAKQYKLDQRIEVARRMGQ
jgi:tetratricopeptide (TPR) repeat protein